jgi:sugar/nucleoside kinase (ribokinase family)
MVSVVTGGVKMRETKVDVTVAGHICLDIIPTFNSHTDSMKDVFVPGKLVDVGAALISTGGAVSNSGIALHRLGLTTQLMGKVSDDLFGKGILEVLRNQGEALDSNMIISPGEQSSYSVVISPPNVDRVFLHCTGTNDTFIASDLKMEEVAQSKLFHFGYPPLMKKMYTDGGRELAELLRSVKKLGLTVTLDMAKPDPSSPAGEADWTAILTKALPYVDVFFPSFEEILYMLDRAEYERLITAHPNTDIIQFATSDLLEGLSSSLIRMGTAAVVLKLGDHGLYVRTSSDITRFEQFGDCSPAELSNWVGRECLVPVYKVEVAGTTGAGDCTIAGFLTGLIKGFSIEKTLTSAVAVGAFSVEKPDSISGVPHWDIVMERIKNGWERKSVNFELNDWHFNEGEVLWTGPNDSIGGINP